MQADRHWMIWDGECGLCSATARWVHKKDRKKQFQIVTYQNTPRPPMTDAIFEQCKSAVVVMTSDGKQFNGADGILFVLEHLGWGVFARILRLPPLVWVMRLGYLVIARNRGRLSRWFFGGQVCGLDHRYPEVDDAS